MSVTPSGDERTAGRVLAKWTVMPELGQRSSVATLLLSVMLVGLAACGSRTGLFPGSDTPNEALTDGGPPPSSPDDAGPPPDDASLPYEPDTSLPPPPSPVPPIDGATPPAAPLCADGGGTTTAYLWGESGTLYTFEPLSLTSTPLGVISCPTTGTPWTLSVSRTGYGYFMYTDWRIYRVNLATLACETTPYQIGQLGFTGSESLAVSRGASESLYVYGMNAAGPTLGVTDLSSFVLSEVGIVTPNPEAFPPDMQADAYGRLFVLSRQGVLAEVSSTNAQLLGLDVTTFTGGQTSWAVMTWNDSVYFFGGDQVSQFDLATQQLTFLGLVSDNVVGASAAACIH